MLQNLVIHFYIEQKLKNDFSDNWVNSDGGNTFDDSFLFADNTMVLTVENRGAL